MLLIKIIHPEVYTLFRNPRSLAIYEHRIHESATW